MTTIVNTPAPTANSSGPQLIIGLVALALFVLFIVYFVVPMFRDMGPVQLNVPAPQIVMPDKVDVNVQQAK